MDTSITCPWYQYRVSQNEKLHRMKIISCHRKCAELLVTIILEDLGALHLNTITAPRSQSVPPVYL